MSKRHIKSSCCSSCGEELNGAINLEDGAQPEPNDVAICLCCGHIMALADDLSLRELTDAEMHRTAGEPELLWLQEIRAEYIRKQS